MTELEVMQAAFVDELSKIAESARDPKKLTAGEKMLAVGTGGVPALFGANKARANDHSALEGGVRGTAGWMGGAGAGMLGGGMLGGAIGRAVGGQGAQDIGSLLGSAAGGIGGGIGGYKALTHAISKPAH